MDHLAFGETRFWVEDLVEIGDRESAASDDQFGFFTHQADKLSCRRGVSHVYYTESTRMNPCVFESPPSCILKIGTAMEVVKPLIIFER
jgi:hypothetical protein